MLRNWVNHVSAWIINPRQLQSKRRGRRTLSSAPNGAIVQNLNSIEALESRLLLTNLVSVNVHGNSITLNDVTRGRAFTGDNFAVSYTENQVTLTATNGTTFKVGNQTLSTYSVKITGPASISISLNPNANVVSITGNGTASLSNLKVSLGAGRQNNSFTLTSVIANDVSITGGRNDDKVTLNQSTIQGNLDARLGTSAGDVLDLESTKVKGNLRDWVSQLIMNQSTVGKSLNDIESANNSSFRTTGSTYTGGVTVSMGRNGVVNMFGSGSTLNHFHSSLTFSGIRKHDITINEHANSVATDVTPRYRHASVHAVTGTVSKPTVNATNTTSNTPTITGTYDSVNAPNLTVTVNGKTYTLGKSSQLTSPTKGTWTLNLTGAPLPSGSTTITVTNTDSLGDSAQATGTVTVVTAPTVNSLSAVINTPTITGTYDATSSAKLTVAVNGSTYTLGTSSQLTSPSAGTWALNLSNASPLPAGSTTVTATSTDIKGNSATGTGTVTTNSQTNSELSSIHAYESKNSLTAVQTNSGLNYVIETKGTGAVPKSGQTITANYSGFLLNSDGTQGTEFDSNVDSKFGHVSPFSFKLGAGQVIAGWDEAFALLPVGTVAKLIIPSALAYGTTGQGTSIPANSVLIFEVTVVSAA